MAIRSFNKARVRVATHAIPTDSQVELTDDLISVTTTKDVGTGPGAYQIELYPANYKTRLFRPGDWCEIYFETVDGEELVMWGPISQVQRRRITGAGGVVQQRLYLSGQDFMRVLEATEIMFDSILWQREYAGFMQALSAKGAFQMQKAGQFIRKLIKIVLEQGNTGVLAKGQWRLPNGKKLLDYVGTALTEILANKKDDYHCVVTTIPTQIPTLMRMCEQYADLPNNYFIGDIRPGNTLGNDKAKKWKPAIILDRHPYDLARFLDLPVTHITNSDVATEDLGWHDQDIRNWFCIMPEIFGSSGDTLAVLEGPYYDPKSIARHGIRRWEHRTNYAFGSSGVPATKDSVVFKGKWTTTPEQNASPIDPWAPAPATPPMTPNTWGKLARLEAVPDIQIVRGPNSLEAGMLKTPMRRQLNRMTTWYGANDEFLNGQLTTRLMPGVRVMSRILYDDSLTDERLHFLVESVSHHWSYAPATSSTQITVSRGFIDNNYPVSPDYIKLVRRMK